MSKQSKNLFNTKDRFGIRKLTIGTASLLLGTVCYIGINSNEVQAAEEPQIEQSNGQPTSTNSSTDQTSDQNTEKSTTETSSQDTTQPVEKVTDQTLKDTSNESTAQKYDQSSNDTTSQDTNQNDENKTDESSSTETKEINDQTENNATEEITDQSNTTLNKQETEKKTDQSTTQDTTQINDKTSDQSSNKETNQSLNEKPVNDTNDIEKEVQNNQPSTETQTDQKSELNQTNQQDLNKSTISNNDSSSQTDKSTQPQESQPKIDNKESNEIVTNENSIQNDSNVGDTTTETQINNDKNNIETSEINNTDALTENKVQDSQPSQPANSQNLNDMPSSNSPFVTIDNATTNPSSPTNPKSPSDNAGEQANQPVVTNRMFRTLAVTNTPTTKNAEYFDDPSLLTDDKYTITSLTSENVKGKDKYTKDTFNTHMTVKLDDSVKAGDKLVYGVGYDYTDLNGTVHKVFLPSSNDYSDHNTPIMYQNVQIGTMKTTAPSYNISNPLRDFSVNEADGVDVPYYAMKGSPVTITFNDNIDKFKDVELTIDNVFVKDKSVIVLNGSTINGLHIDPGYNSDNIIRNADGSVLVDIPNEFKINDQTKDLNLQIAATEDKDKLSSLSTFNNNQSWNYTTMNRDYIDTPNGLYVNDDNLLVYRSAAPSKTPTNQLHYHVVIPKALQEKADFAFAGIDNTYNIKFNEDYLAPHQDTISAQSKFNPTTFDQGVYSGFANNVTTTSRNIDWDITRNLTTNDNGDLVYDVTFKTKDGSYVTTVNDPVFLYAYKLKEELPHSTPESYDNANKHVTGQKWGIPEWDQLLKANPIMATVESSTESGVQTVNATIDKEGYRLTQKTAQTAPEGAIRVAAKDEVVKDEAKTEVIPFTTKRIPDPTLNSDVEIVDQTGVNGEKSYTERTFTRTTDGQVTAVERLNETITKEPIEEIIRYGVDTDINTLTYPSQTSFSKTHEFANYQEIRNLNMNMEPNSPDVTVIEGKDGRLYKGGYGQINLINQNNVFNNINDTARQAIFDKEKEKFIQSLNDRNIEYKNLNINDFTPIFDDQGKLVKYNTKYTYDYVNPYVEDVINKEVDYAPTAYDKVENHEDILYTTKREINWDLKPGSEDVVITKGENGYNETTGHYLTGHDDSFEDLATWGPYFDENRESLSDEDKTMYEEKLLNSNHINELKEHYPNLEVTQFSKGDITIKTNETTDSKEAVEELIQYAPVEIDYETREIPTNKLAKNVREVQSEGKLGLKDPETGEIRIQPEDRVILVGTGIEDETIDTVTTEIPFDTHYTYDQSKPSGYIKTTTEGQVGIQEVTVTQKTIDGESIGEPTYSEPVTKQEKIDKEVVIGTGVVGKDTKVEDITTKYKTEVRENDKLPIGTRNVIKQGQVGIDRQTTIHYTLNGEDDPTKDDDVSIEHIQDKIDEIVEIGTAVEGVRTETKEILVDYPTSTIDDTSLPEGQTEVVQKGEKGIDRVTTTFPTLNGEDNGEGTSSTERIKEPVTEIIKVGKGIVGENKDTTTQDIPFETETIESDSIPEGKTEVAREGQNGVKTITTITPTLNGETNGDSKDFTVITQQPINKIIIVGTGKETSETTHYDTEVQFDKEIIYDDKLKKGETETRQVGKNGIDRTTVTTHYLNGKQYGDQDSSNDRIIDPVNEIIAVGTAVEVQDKTVEQTEVDYKTEYIDIKELKPGETRIKQAGQKGIDTTTTIRTLLNDEIINTDTNTVRTKEPVTEIIERGIGEVGSTSSETEYEIPYGHDEEFDDTLEQGKREVIKKGENGLDIIKITRPTLNGEIDETGEVSIEKTHVKDPINEIVRIGTGIKGSNTKETIEEVGFETEYVDNDQLPKGEEVIKINGQIGFDKIITTETTMNGKVIDSSDEITRLKNPIKQVIERGTGVVDVKTDTNTVKVPFDEKEVFDKNLKQGERIIDIQGEEGIDTIITTTPTLNGKTNGDSTTRVEHTKQPVTQIVRVGTGIEGQNTTTENVTIPFETKYIDDETLPKGQEIVEINGEDGIDKVTTIIPTFNGEELKDQAKTSTESVKKPVDKVIRRGTGIVDVKTETKTELLKFETDKIFDNDLPEGYKEVLREGTNGEVTITIETPTLNGNDNGNSKESRTITKRPVNEIIKIGTGKLTTQLSQNAESQPFKIIYKDDPTIPKGETKIERKGQNGLVITTTEQDYVNGKKYGEPRVTTSQNKNVIDQIVLIGTKEPVKPVEPTEPSHPTNPVEPTNNQYEPNGGHINKDFGQKTSDDEIKNKITIPNYIGEKPLIIIDNTDKIPDGQTSGDFSVSVTVKYPDGSTDHTIVIIHVGDKSNVNQPNDNKPNDNKPNDNKPNDSKQNDNKPDAKPNNPSNDQPSRQTNHKKDLNDDKFNNKSSQNITHIINNQVKKSESSNMESIVSNIKQQETIKENVINELKYKYNISQKEVMQNHEKEVNRITQDRITKNQQINELPQTGESSKAGLWASMLALLGGMTLLTRRKTKKEEK